jgi:Double-GTPase 2
LMKRARSVLCPYCFNRWSTNVAAFRCLSTDRERCPPVPDEAQGRLLGIEAPLENRVLVRAGRLGTAFRPKPGEPIRCDCRASTYPVCPICHSRLPQLFAEADSHSLALIGTKDSGKSHYIAVVLHELDHRVGPRLDGSLMLLDEHTRTRVTTELLPRLYKEGVVLAPTQQAQLASSPVSLPLVARLSLGMGKNMRHSNLVFFDAAGEDLESLSVLEREARYVTQSDGLILLVDPLQIPAIRNEITDIEERDLPALSTDPKTMLTRLTALLREARGIASDKQIEMPLAITLSKLDAIRGLLPADHPALGAIHPNGAYDRQGARNLSDTLRADLAAWLGEGFDRFVAQNFANVGYFAMSALGEAPAGGRITHGVAPYRVEEPVLWMLDRWGALPAGGG